ncbi:MAG: cell division protein ZapA [Rhodocyclales bacterium GWA2_65_19]|nr:MAG: cell division protein ZapA [Rhodocyclales bacterium GWA2_65_19]
MSDTLEVKLLGKDYRVACKPAEREALLAAVAFLDGKLKEAGDKTRSSGEGLAVMVALNLVHEFLAAKNAPADLAAALESESIQRRIDFIEAKLDESLAQHEQLF